jgi:beta-xylosidase
MKRIITILFILFSAPCFSQGLYTNPIIHADYSDPDAIRVGDDYYMISSSFNHMPGLPILHSKDLVHWELIGHALLRQPPYDHYNIAQHGNGVWAPSIRFHNNEFYIYYPDPDYGIYLIKAKNINGPWSQPVLVQEGKGLIDPCPLWDDDGRVYLVHAFAGSRAGIKSIIVVKELNKEGDKVIGEGVLVYDGHAADPTVEGPKFYKRNGYYYIFAPAGGVSTGWQIVLRSKQVYGPYERRIVMAKGETTVNGPHQGAWINTITGEDWFIHFQDKDAYGRILHLQPMKWINDWPVIGSDPDGDGIGEPVDSYKMPKTKYQDTALRIITTDEFNAANIGRQWQWQANPDLNWAFMDPSHGVLRMNSYLWNDSSLYNDPSLLLQKFPAESFTATTRIDLSANNESARMGLIVFGLDYAAISIVGSKEGIKIQYAVSLNADKSNKEKMLAEQNIAYSHAIYLRVIVSKGGICSFGFSTDGNSYTMMKEQFTARPGKWVGAKLGLFCTRTAKTNDAGYADIDWFRITGEKN